ncbi:MAG: hypothetical protein KAJ48_05990 [Elusimicrobiales bacterium]|nr:hypothetical protein [Elusimicrobiales bacterium]
MDREYKITSTNAVVCDDCLYPLRELSLVIFDGLDTKRIKELNFHAEQNDYFGTLATILNNLSGDDFSVNTMKKVLSELRDDLEYMQDNYRLVKK